MNNYWITLLKRYLAYLGTVFFLCGLIACNDDSSDSFSEQSTPAAESLETSDQSEIISSLLASGIDPEVRDSVYEWTIPKIYGYRLGDMFRQDYWHKEEKGDKSYHLNNFPISIASEYMRQTNESNNYEVLKGICDAYFNNNAFPSTNLLIMHLRIGDVIDWRKNSVNEFLSKPIAEWWGDIYVQPLSFYKKIALTIKKYQLPIDSIELVGGFHTPLDSVDKSLAYVSAIKGFGESEGFTVTTRLDHPADDDFLYMINASYFTPSGGGFSKVIKRMVELNGGHIIEPLVE